MAKKRSISRRQFLVGATAALGGAALLSAQGLRATEAVTRLATTLTLVAYLLFVAHKHIGPPYWGKVVHVYSTNATDWIGEDDYWNHVDQEVVNQMVDRGLMELTGAATVAGAWRGLIPACQPVNAVSQPPFYRSDYNPLVDLIRSPLIGGKTVLTLGDGLFASRHWVLPPVPWTTFDGKVPNSLFFAKDPVAIDCLMHDLLAAEPGTNVVAGANNYLRLAAEAKLGIFEQGNPWQTPYGSGYQDIQYVRVDL